MSGLYTLEGFSLDDVDEVLFSTMNETGKLEPLSPEYQTSPGINFDEDAFIWEDVKLSDGVLSQVLSQQEPSSPQSNTQHTNVVLNEELMSTAANIPDIDILQRAMVELPMSPSTSEDSDGEMSRSGNQPNPQLSQYGLTDETLSDMSLKKLRALCKGDVEEFNQLKAFRRTCLNRHYARSSRAKSQNKALGMSTELGKAKNAIDRLTKQNADQASTIKYLQLELEVLRAMKN